MHLTDFSKNLIGSFGIVGAGIPVAVGAAMSAKLRGEPRVSVTFFGDGAVNIGAFHEALNMAAVWKAPVVFVCENNIYGEFSRFDETTSVNPLSIRAAAYGIPGYRLDGNNILEVYETAKRVIEAARRGEGPSFVEAVTYRQRGHSRTDPAKYRPEEEVAAWLEYDPIHLFEKWLIHHRILEELDIERLKEQVRRRVALAAERAEAAPWPDIDELYTDVYAEC